MSRKGPLGAMEDIQSEEITGEEERCFKATSFEAPIVYIEKWVNTFYMY